MKIDTNHLYRFVSMTSDAELIEVWDGCHQSKAAALEFYQRLAAKHGKEMGILYVSCYQTKECAIYTAKGKDWLQQRLTKMNRKENQAAIAIGRRLQQLRIAQGKTTGEVCDAAGIKPSTLHAIEVGAYNTGIREISKVAEALGATISIE